MQSQERLIIFLWYNLIKVDLIKYAYYVFGLRIK